MKITQRNPILALVNDYLIDSPTPSNISYLWNFGSLLGLNLVLMIITGIVLAMHYIPSTSQAFDSIEYIMRSVNYGWLIRYLHANGASFFFLWLYCHIARGLYYGSYKAPRALAWNIGVIILICSFGTAFLGYVLPFGQMSFWAATVITNLLSSIPWIGQDLVGLIWGSYSVDQPTLNRFFSLHYLLPFIITALVCMHLLALHVHASNNPEGVASTSDRIRFHPYYTTKDIVGFFIMAIALCTFVFFSPNLLGHADNYIPANPLVTPLSIVPEWYLLPYYAILRAIPSKLGGVIGMFGSMLILIPLSFIGVFNLRSNRYRPILNLLYWMFIFNFLFLLWLGARPIASPFIELGQLSTLFYFAYFLLLLLMG